MGQFAFFTYLRLKIIVTFLRVVLRLTSFSSFRRDNILSQDIERRRVRIPSRDRGRSIVADLYHPAVHSQPSSVGVKPILVNFHGSGFVLPFLGSDSLFCARVVRDTGIFVLDVDYRKAPETPFPGALDDVEDALRWVSTQSDRFDMNRVCVSGFSAGGNLALVAASALKKKLVNITIPIVVAVYPVTNLSIAPEAKTVPHPRKPIPPSMAKLFNDCYVPDKAIRTDPRVSPSLADPADFPPTVAILTCEGDILMPEANALADKLDDGRRKVVNRTLKAVHHGFDKGVKKETNEWKQREEAYALSVKTIKVALNL